MADTKRAPRDAIENVSDPQNEHWYMKFPGKEMKPRLLKKTNARMAVAEDKYTEPNQIDVHTHPGGTPLPSPKDIRNLLYHPLKKTMVIAQTDSDSGKLEGYFVLRKTKDTLPVYSQPMGFWKKLKDFIFDKEFRHQFQQNSKILENYDKVVRDLRDGKERVGAVVSPLDDVCDTYHLQKRFVPAEGYVWNKENGAFYCRQYSANAIEHAKSLVGKSDALTRCDAYGTRRKSVESKLTIILGFLGSLLFIGSNITGNTIGNLNSNSMGLMGIFFFFIGILGVLIYSKKKK